MSNMIYNNMINNYFNNYMRVNLTNTKTKKSSSNTKTSQTGNVNKNSEIFNSDKSTIKLNTINSSSKTNSSSNIRSHNVKTGGVQEFISKNPKEAYNVRRMLAQGKAVKKSYPAEKSNSDMTMDEYKEYIMDTINKLPRDISQLHDDITVNITEEGWETMKADPEYEAWVLGYFKEDFSVKIPYNGMGTDGIKCVEHFGATIGEHHGESVARTTEGLFGNNNNSWWNTRDDKLRQVLERNSRRNSGLNRNNKNLLNRGNANLASIMSAYESGTIKNTRLLGNSMILKKR